MNIPNVRPVMLPLKQRCVNREKPNIINVNLVPKVTFHMKEDVSKNLPAKMVVSKKANTVYAPKVGRVIYAKQPQNVPTPQKLVQKD